MRDEQIGRMVRTLRHRRGWRQSDLSARAARPRSALVDLEAGCIGQLKLDTVRAFAEALGARLDIELRAGAGDPRLLLDAQHAFLQDGWKRRLESWSWATRAEVSFNHYGDRGRIDLLAFHPALRVLLVIEVKTVLLDLQATLGGLDVKARVSRSLARELGWMARAIVPMLIVSTSTTARRRIADHPALFASFALRGRRATAWLRSPGEPPTGLLCLSKAPDVAPGDRRRAGRRRVRLSTALPRSADGPMTPNGGTVRA